MAGPVASLLDLSTRDAARRIAGRHLDAATRAFRRLKNPGDPRGLHSFRVAVRRLRSLLRAYRASLAKAAGRKIRRRLRRLTRATNATRDADVQLERLATMRRQLDREEHPGYDWLLPRLRARRVRSYRSAAPRLRADFPRAARLARRRLDAARQGQSPTFRAAFVAQLDPVAAELRRRLAAIAGANDERTIHRARIQVKRLRYLVEPLRGELAEARAVVRPLKRLQQLFGELHDMHVLEAALSAALDEAAAENARRLRELALGLVAVVARTRESRNALFVELRRQWLAKQGSFLAPELRSLRAAAASGPRAERRQLIRAR